MRHYPEILQALQVGDLAYLSQSDSHRTRLRKAKVTKITPSGQVAMELFSGEALRFMPNGNEVGVDKYSRRRHHHLTKVEYYERVETGKTQARTTWTDLEESLQAALDILATRPTAKEARGMLDLPALSRQLDRLQNMPSEA